MTQTKAGSRHRTALGAHLQQKGYTEMTPQQHDRRNLRRRAYNHGRSPAEQAHVEALAMMGTHRADVIVRHLALAVAA